MNGGVLWLTLVGAGIASIVGFMYFSRRKLTAGREPMDMEAVHAYVSAEVSLEGLRDVLNSVGQAFSIDPRLLRPEDSLTGLLNADSWQLDAGTEKINKWLADKGLEERLAPEATILDLAKLLGSRHR